MEGFPQMYAALFTIALISSVVLIAIIITLIVLPKERKKQFLKGLLYVFILIVLLCVFWRIKNTTFTTYTIVRNQISLDYTLHVSDNAQANFFKLSNGKIYTYVEKYPNKDHALYFKKRLALARSVMIEDKGELGMFLYSVSYSNGYIDYLNRKKFKYTISFFNIKINQYAGLKEGKILEVNVNKIIEGKHLISELSDQKCCNMSIIELSIKYDGNTRKSINENNLLHVVFDFEKNKYFQYRTQLMSLMLNKYKVDINQINSDRDTVIFRAVRKTIEYSGTKFTKDDQIFMQTILDAGVDLNITNVLGQTVFMYAVENKNFKLAELLLINGSLFAYAYPFEDSDQNKIKRMLEEHKLLESQESIDNKTYTKNLQKLLTIMNSITKGELQDKRNRKIKNTQVEPTEYLKNELTYSRYCCDLLRIERVLKHGEGLASFINGHRVLHSITRNNKFNEYRVPLLEMFLNVPGVNPNQMSYSDQQTIFHVAINKIKKNVAEKFDQTDKDFFQMLLDNNVDQNLENSYGKTPLTLAIFGKQYLLAQFLIEKGAHFSQKQVGKESAKDVVLRKIDDYINPEQKKIIVTQEQYLHLVSLLKLMEKSEKETSM